jgi:hypothetical protein
MSMKPLRAPKARMVKGICVLIICKLTHYIYLYLLERRYLTGFSKHLGGGTGRVRDVHGERRS